MVILSKFKAVSSNHQESHVSSIRPVRRRYVIAEVYLFPVLLGGESVRGCSQVSRHDGALRHYEGDSFLRPPKLLLIELLPQRVFLMLIQKMLNHHHCSTRE